MTLWILGLGQRPAGAPSRWATSPQANTKNKRFIFTSLDVTVSDPIARIEMPLCRGFQCPARSVGSTACAQVRVTGEAFP